MDAQPNGFVTEAELLEGSRKVVETSGRKYLVRRLRRSRVIGILGNIPDLFEALEEKDAGRRRARVTEAVSRANPQAQVEKMEAVVAAGLVSPRISETFTLDDLPPEDFGPLFSSIWELAGMGGFGDAKAELDPTSATGSSASSSTESPVATAVDPAG